MEHPSEKETAHKLLAQAAGDGVRRDDDGGGERAAVSEQGTVGLAADFDTQGHEDDSTALLHAVRNGRTDIAQSLLEQGASTENRDRQSRTPLIIAAERGNVELIDLLCRFGANVNATGEGGQTALHRAVALIFTDAVSSLLAHGASADLIDGNGATPLDFALATRNFATAKLLVASGAAVRRERDPPATGTRSYNWVWRACSTGDLAFVIQLVEALDEIGATDTKHALVNMPFAVNWTPLNAAADRGDLNLVALLVIHGADLETKADQDFSALYIATNKGHADVVQRLLASGANAEATDSGGCTPLMVASADGFESIVGMLLAHGANVNHRDMDGFSALATASMEGRGTIVQSLLAHGAEPEIRNNKGWTSLLLAADSGHTQVVQLLIDHGADLDYQSYDNWTPLTRAAVNGDTAMCSLLLEQGASTEIQTTDGQTALHLAAARNHHGIIRLLLGAGADRYARDFDGRSAAQLAAMKGYYLTTERLDQRGTGTTVRGDDTWHLGSLREVYGENNTSKRATETLRLNPPWYIDPSTITAIEPCPHLTTPAAQVSIGMWTGSSVLIVQPEITSVQNLRTGARSAQRVFRKEVSKLYPLRHPHVIKLYGACHRGEKPFLVIEHAENGGLRSFVGMKPWAILHQVSLGVQYLHERGIVHGQLRGENIFLGDDGLVKLSAIEVYSMALSTPSTIEWDAPEVIENEAASFESDVYSLGMCIIEAVGGEPPYAVEAAERRDLKKLIAAGVLPNKPAAFTTRGWELVMRMISFHPGKRLKIADIERELAALAQDEELRMNQPTSNSDEEVCALNDDSEMEERLALALTLLSASKDGIRVDSGDETDTPQRQVLGRLRDGWTASRTLSPSRHQLMLRWIQDILRRFTNDLQTQVSMGLAANFAAQRQHVDRIFSFHNEIDGLLDQHCELLDVHTRSTTTINIHAWRDRWHAHRRAQLQAFGSWLERVEDLDMETCTCLLFELTKRRDTYTSISPTTIQAACIKMRSMPGVCVPDWFIPHYEVVFEAFKSFSRGAFGSVHRGEWMGSPVVIKKVFAEDDSEFEKEVEIWSRLYHPHVLQLFGACHVGQKFIMSEFAEHGQLDHCLRRLEKQPTKREREVWRTLYEAALGLQYLHSRGVVHCDLKCNNILIGRDGKAKVSDYGLSRVREQCQQPDEAGEHSTHDKPTGVGAPRWKAPEVLNGGEPSFESDVYSFGMCVVEAVSGEYPWGMRIGDELVSDHVRGGGALFSKPRGFSDEQWSLAVGACRFDPCERLQLEEVVTQLEVFANDASEVETPVGVSSIDIDWLAASEPDMVGTSDSISFSEVVLPVAIDSLTIELADCGSSTIHSSYSESW